jgi:hypothetical protein
MLNKNEFIKGQGTAVSEKIIGARHLSNLIEAYTLFLADGGHYDRFCHGSHGINRIHMRSWILTSTGSLDRLFLQSGELIIVTPAQGKMTRSVGSQLEKETEKETENQRSSLRILQIYILGRGQ